MSARAQVLERFSDTGCNEPMWMPDLIAWYNWHRDRGTLGPSWDGRTLQEVARSLSVPVWSTVRPWRAETPGITVEHEDSADTRIVRYLTPRGVLTARWSLGPDGDWWQTEYPVKALEDLAAASAIVEARVYAFDPADWMAADAAVGDEGVVAIELPRRPYSEVLHVFLGWSEGLLLMLGDGQEAVTEIIGILEEKVQNCVRQAAGLPGQLAYSPDNLDGQYVSPPVFRAYLAASYANTVAALRECGKSLLVHAGGPVRRLLPLLAAAGVDGLEGVGALPEGDVTLAEARAAVGPHFTLWGGIPQDLLHPGRAAEDFENAVVEAVRQSRGDGRAILGAADMVPVTADPDRLRRVQSLIAGA